MEYVQKKSKGTWKQNVLKRGYYIEFIKTGQHVILVELLAAMYLVSMQEGELFSRFILYSFAVIYMLISYPVRLLWKAIIRKQTDNGRETVAYDSCFRR